MSDVVIQSDRFWKKCRLGVLGTGTLRHDFNRWLHRIAGKPDPYAVVGGPTRPQDNKTTRQHELDNKTTRQRDHRTRPSVP